MTELATLIEKRRIAQNRLNDKSIKRRKSEIEDLEKYIKALDWAINKQGSDKDG